jgi:acetyl esterase/lipase
VILSWLVLAAASVLLFLSAWIVVPAWNYPLLVLAVGGTEYSPWLCAGSVLVCVLARGRSRSSRAAFLIAGCAALISSIPLARAPFALRRFDLEMTRALGDGFLNDVPAASLLRMRPRPIVVADLFRPIEWGDAAVVRGIPVASPQGQPLTATVYRPRARGRFPAIVQIHGGSWQHGDANEQDWFARYFAARGYVVFSIEYRLAPRWQWPAQSEDVRTAFDWVRRHAGDYRADASRLAVVGRSAGAHLAMLTAFGQPPQALRAVVSFYGPVDLAGGYREPPSPDPMGVRALEAAFLGGTPDSVPDRYRDASPITYVAGKLPPTLIINGGRDHVIAPRWGRLLHDRQLANGTVSALLEIPWAEHSFDSVENGPSAQIALYYTERFLAWALR